MGTDHFDVLAIVLTVCEQQDGLCMDVAAERLRLALAITDELDKAALIAPTAQ
jgi:hypothetical protein